MECLIFVLVVWAFPSESLLRAQADAPGDVLSERVLKSNEPAVAWANLQDRMRLVVAENDGPLLRVTYPRGGWGSHHSGAQIKFKFPAANSASCRYRVRFASEFDFAKGGKLPGLAGGTATSGNKRPNGDGWTARLMWRRRGDAVLYLYHLDQKRKYGDDFSLDVRFQPGRWYDVRQRVTVNRPNQSDGRIQIWMDGEMVLDQKNLRLRIGEQAPVDGFYFSTFFGGSGDDWAPSTEQTIDFAGISVWPS